MQFQMCCVGNRKMWKEGSFSVGMNHRDNLIQPFHFADEETDFKMLYFLRDLSPSAASEIGNSFSLFCSFYR